jgi:lipoprotein-releasing system ATP-binding protein
VAEQIRILGLIKTYYLKGRPVPVLTGFDFSIAAGELASLTGVSGAGKSTFLNVLGTLDAPTAGRILFEGEDLFQNTRRRLAEFRNRTIGFVFQFHHLLPDFTALENVMMPALIARAAPAEARRTAAEVLDEVGLSSRLDHRPGELSGGEQQRVAVARALVMEPRLLLADEPTGNLDEGTAEDIHALLIELNRRRGTTMIVATHNTALARRLRKRLRVANGVIQEVE